MLPECCVDAYSRGITTRLEAQDLGRGEATSQMRFLSHRLRTAILLTLVGMAHVGCVSMASPLPMRFQEMLGHCSQSCATGSHWAEQVVLGSSSVELNGPWKFHKGDDMQWAQPGFNDSGWASVDLTPPPGFLRPVPWNQRIHAGLDRSGQSGLLGICVVPAEGQRPIRSRIVSRADSKSKCPTTWTTRTRSS